MLGLTSVCPHPCRLAASVTSAMPLVGFRAATVCQRLRVKWFNALVKERVNKKHRVLYFVQCLFFTSCYPMGSCLIVGGLCMLQEIMSKGIPEPVPSLRVESERA